MASAETTLTLLNKVGLHARPASKFVQTAARFSSTITVVCGARQANAKSILQVLGLGAGGGAEVTLQADGADAEAAIAALQQLIEERFGESE
ncbi:MAG TPA: HPr family phosphocarrier protein [Ktedonobacterales bacterium]|nr:HPr family phosphocarrier protein [Ktedonobacterales bacterium]